MIAKIICKGNSRTDVIRKMTDFLQNMQIEGIKTNKEFLIEVLKNNSFNDAKFNTKFIENNLSIFTKYEDKKEIKEEIVKHIKTEEKKEIKKEKSENKNYTEKDVKAFENIISKVPKKSNGQN